MMADAKSRSEFPTIRTCDKTQFTQNKNVFIRVTGDFYAISQPRI